MSKVYPSDENNSKINFNSKISNEKSIRPFPKLGIKLEGMLNFISSIGGSDKLKLLNTEDICKYVKDCTQHCKLSYCDCFKNDQKIGQYIMKANVFISHAWKYNFLSVIDAIIGKYTGDDSIVFWFDLFSNNQHLDDAPTFEWWCTSFQSAIKDIGVVVLIAMPWDNAIPFTRAWCLWEIYCAVICKVSFTILIDLKDVNELINALNNDSEKILDIISNIDLRLSDAWSPIDLFLIKKAVEETVGFQHLNRVIIDKIIESIMLVIKSSIEDKKFNWAYCICLGQLYIARRNHIEGFKCFFEIIKNMKSNNYMNDFIEESKKSNKDALEEKWSFIFRSLDGLGRAAFALKSESELWKFYSTVYHVWHKYNAVFSISYHNCFDNISYKNEWRKVFIYNLLKSPSPEKLRLVFWMYHIDSIITMNRRKYYDTAGEFQLKNLLAEQKRIFSKETKTHSHIIDTYFRLITIQYNKCKYNETLKDIENLMNVLQERGWGSRKVIVGEGWKKVKQFENIEAKSREVYHIKWWQISIYKAACLIEIEKFNEALELLNKCRENLYEKFGDKLDSDDFFPMCDFLIAKVKYLIGGSLNLDEAMEILKNLRDTFTSNYLSNTTRLLIDVEELLFRASYSRSICGSYGMAVIPSPICFKSTDKVFTCSETCFACFLSNTICIGSFLMNQNTTPVITYFNNNYSSNLGNYAAFYFLSSPSCLNEFFAYSCIFCHRISMNCKLGDKFLNLLELISYIACIPSYFNCLLGEPVPLLERYFIIPNKCYTKMQYACIYEPYCYESWRLCSVSFVSKTCNFLTKLCYPIYFFTNCHLCYYLLPRQELRDRYSKQESCISNYKEEQIVRRGREIIREPFCGSGSYKCICLTITSCCCYCCTCGINLANYFEKENVPEYCNLGPIRYDDDIAQCCFGWLNYFYCCQLYSGLSYCDWNVSRNKKFQNIDYKPLYYECPVRAHQHQLLSSVSPICIPLLPCKNFLCVCCNYEDSLYNKLKVDDRVTCCYILFSIYLLPCIVLDTVHKCCLIQVNSTAFKRTTYEHIQD